MTLGTLVGYLHLDDENFVAGVTKARDKLDGFGRSFGGFAAGMATGALKAGAAIAGIGAGVQVVGGLVGVLGAAAGALPVLAAGALAAKFGMTALTLATDGFGEAMSSMDDPAAFAEAIAELAPAARETALAVRDLKPAWDGMKASLQEKLFEGLGPVVSQLGGTYLPLLSDGFGRVAFAANGAAKDVGEMMSNGERVERMRGMVGNFAAVWEELLPAVGQVGVALLDVLSVGSSFLPGMVSGALDAAQAFSLWAESAEGQARLRDIMSQGLSVLGQLGQVAGNVGGILSGIFKAADTGGAGFLDRLVVITGELSRMVNSVDGQEALGAFFATAAELSGLFMEALRALLPVLPELVTLVGMVATTVGEILVGALTAVAPYLEQFAQWLTDNPGLVQFLVVAIGLLAGAVWLGIGALNAYLAVSKIVTTWSALMASGWLTSLAAAATTAAGWVVSWVMMAASALASAASMALSWLIAIAPIALVIAAVAGLVYLIVTYWDEIVAWTQQAWTNVVTFLTDTGNKIVSTVDGWAASVRQFVIDCWNNAVQFTKDAWNRLVASVQSGVAAAINWVRGLPGQILGILGGIGGQLVASGRKIVDDFLAGIQAGWNKLMGWVQSGMDMLRGLWPFSPAKWGPFSGRGYVTHSGKALTGDFAQSIRSGLPGIAAAAADVMGAAQVALTPILDARPTGLPGDGWLTPAPTAAGTTTREGDRVVQVTVNNPTAERASDSLGRRARTVAALGPFGGRS